MKKITKNYKRLKIQEVKIAVLAIITFIFFMPGYTNIENTGNNLWAKAAVNRKNRYICVFRTGMGNDAVSHKPP
mgnify:CR=1 FL=1